MKHIKFARTPENNENKNVLTQMTHTLSRRDVKKKKRE